MEEVFTIFAGPKWPDDDMKGWFVFPDNEKKSSSCGD
jgi:hypothetical protein